VPKKKVDREEGPAEAPTPSPGAAKPVLVAKWVVWLATAGALGIAGYFIGGSDVAQTQWASGKNYVLKQTEIIKRDGLESWARGTVPESLKKPTREDQAKSADDQDAKQEKDKSAETAVSQTAVEPEKKSADVKAEPQAKTQEKIPQPVATPAEPKAPAAKTPVEKAPRIAKGSSAPASSVERAPATPAAQRLSPAQSALSLSDAERESLSTITSAIIAEWASKWSAQDFAGYAGHYSRNFANEFFPNISTWLKFRKSRIVGREKIQVDVHDLRLVDVSGQNMVIDFVQRWESGGQVIFSLKQISLTQELADWWTISRETATDVPAAHPAVVEALKLPAIERKAALVPPASIKRKGDRGRQLSQESSAESSARKAPESKKEIAIREETPLVPVAPMPEPANKSAPAVISNAARLEPLEEPKPKTTPPEVSAMVPERKLWEPKPKRKPTPIEGETLSSAEKKTANLSLNPR
jgi:hypothetical protein